MSQPRICPVCGYQLLDNEDTCIICGKKIKSKPPNNTYNNSSTCTEQQQQKTASTVRTYSSGPSRTVNPTSQPNNTETQTMYREFKTTTEKKKMPTVLKVFLIIFAIQFIVPIIMTIAAVVFALININDVTKQVNTLINQDINIIEISEQQFDENDFILRLDNEANYSNPYVSENDIMMVKMNLGTSQLTIFVNAIDKTPKFLPDYLSQSNNNSNIIIQLYGPDEGFSSNLEAIDFDNHENVKRLDDIKFGIDTFESYTDGYSYIFVCEYKTDYYIVCKVINNNGKYSNNLQDIFPILAMDKY